MNLNSIELKFSKPMKYIFLKQAVFVIALLLATHGFGTAQTTKSSRKSLTTASRNIGKESLQIEERNVRAQMEFLASDALQGRGSGTQFEWLTGQYIASQLRQFGVEPAGQKDASGEKTYIQTVNITRNSFDEAPKLNYNAENNQPIVLEHGKEMVVLRMNAERVEGALQKINLGEKPKAGSVAFVKLRESDDVQNVMQKLQAYSTSGAAAVIIEETPQLRSQWNNFSNRKISFTNVSNNNSKPFSLIVVSTDAATS
jgi:hypothetical protein